MERALWEQHRDDRLGFGSLVRLISESVVVVFPLTSNAIKTSSSKPGPIIGIMLRGRHFVFNKKRKKDKLKLPIVAAAAAAAVVVVEISTHGLTIHCSIMLLENDPTQGVRYYCQSLVP